MTSVGKDARMAEPRGQERFRQPCVSAQGHGSALRFTAYGSRLPPASAPLPLPAAGERHARCQRREGNNSEDDFFVQEERPA